MTKEDTPPALPALQQDLERGLRFTHRLGMQAQRELLDATSGLLALVEELVDSGHLDAGRFEARLREARLREAERLQGQARVEVAESVDKYALTDLPEIPCAELLPLCKARCCRLHFTLSYQDLDEGVVRWDYDRPYRIRRKADGACHHLAAGGGCQIYAQRPAVCRRFDCRRDPRIWLDYERRIPAPEEERPLTVE
jgi:Fe-S-cluster containining protein